MPNGMENDKRRKRQILSLICFVRKTGVK
jgi:hypothetical protein